MTVAEEGICRLCGRLGRLTFEHIPPHAAFNDQPMVLAKIRGSEAGATSDEMSFDDAEHLPDGRGARVLCERCNNETGGAYGSAFANWCRFGLESLDRAPATARFIRYDGVIQPLRVLKQIATIFFATGTTRFREAHPYLQKFVLDLNTTRLPPEYDFRVFWYGGGHLRQSSVSATVNWDTGSVNVLSEFIHPPFGYVLSLAGRMFDRRPEEISFFANYGPSDHIQFNRTLPRLPSHWIMPGDYRSLDEIERDRRINELAELGHPEPEAGASGLDGRYES